MYIRSRRQVRGRKQEDGAGKWVRGGGHDCVPRELEFHMGGVRQQA